MVDKQLERGIYGANSLGTLPSTFGTRQVLFYDTPDGSGGSDATKNTGDKTKTGDDDFKDIPESVRQKLIDKGVNIGIARAKEQHEKELPKHVDKALKDLGVSKEDIETLKPVLGKYGSLQKLYEVYGTEDLDEIATMIDDQEREQMSEHEQLEADYEALQAMLLDKENQISALQKGMDDRVVKLTEREKSLLSVIEKRFINGEIRSIAKGMDAYDADDVVPLVRPFVKVEEVDGDFVAVVVDDKGNKRYDSQGNPITLESLVQDILDRKPHLRKSNLTPGTGNQGGKNTPAGTGLGKWTKEQLKDPKFFNEHRSEILAAVKSGNVKL